jgi:hypothetical protein
MQEEPCKVIANIAQNEQGFCLFIPASSTESLLFILKKPTLFWSFPHSTESISDQVNHVMNAERAGMVTITSRVIDKDSISEGPEGY